LRIKKTRRNLLEYLPRLSLLFSFLLVFSSADLAAAEKGKPAVELKIGTILASNDSDCVDPNLSKMKKQLEVIKYRCYRLIKEETQKVPWQLNATFDIPGGRSLVVMPQEYRYKRISLKVGLLEGDKPILDTTVRIPNHGNVLLGGSAHEDGVLIFLISPAIQ
jgi:hypothetical protein